VSDARLPDGYESSNEYTRIIVDEALARGIDVVVLDPELGELELTRTGRTHTVIQSLSELTSAIAFRRCDDKAMTRRVLTDAGLPVPPGRVATGDDADEGFLAEHGSIVVKPCRGEGGAGISVGVTEPADLGRAVASARATCERVLLEAMVPGEDLRVLVIDGEVVAASVRRPPAVVGEGSRTVRALVEVRNERRTAELGPGMVTPLDGITEACVRAAGHDLDDVLDDGVELQVRRTANLHSGGTIHDMTACLHPTLADAAVRGAAAIGLPVAGVDLMVDSPEEARHVFIEVNEQPGLANHEPQPTAQRYLDLLFPATRQPAS
jgi:GNAT-family acetyltransferase (TIGR03103 family)